MVAAQALDQAPSLLRLLAHRALAPLGQAQNASFQVACSCVDMRRRSWDRSGRGVGSRFPAGLRCSGGCSVGAFGIVRLHQRLFPPQQSSRFVTVRSQWVSSSGRLVITETRVRGKSAFSRR
ncbi:hypothetical protein M758_UG077100 [Ceratodon purpureus]|nr:hypothetical protein M758_UG077100 [Ceratodon purpureus]